MSDTTTAADIRRSRLAGAGLILTGAILFAGVVLPLRSATSLSASKGPEHKVTLCHRTASHRNPYVSITVDVSAVFKKGHDHHDGVVFYPGIPKGEKWGDIIPAFDYGTRHYDGKNLTAAGLAILGKGCAVPVTTTTAPATTTSSTSTTSTSTTSTSTTAPATTTTVPGGTTTTAPVRTTTTVRGATTTVPRASTSVAAAVVTTSPGSPTTAPAAHVEGEQQSRTGLAATGTSAILLGGLAILLVLAGTTLIVLAERRHNAA